MRLLLPLEAEVEPSGIEDVRFIVGGLFACVGGSELILAFAQSNPPKMLVHALCQPLYLCTHTPVSMKQSYLSLHQDQRSKSQNIWVGGSTANA
jgi:hypothetical protein